MDYHVHVTGERVTYRHLGRNLALAAQPPREGHPDEVHRARGQRDGLRGNACTRREGLQYDSCATYFKRAGKR